MSRSRFVRHIHFSDCDPAQIVFYPRYFMWFDQATETMFRDVGLNWEEMFAAEAGAFAGVPLLNASADFRSPCRMGDRIEIESWVEEWQEKTFVVRHAVHNGADVAVEGRELRIWVVRAPGRAAGIKAASVPDDVRRRLGAR